MAPSPAHTSFPHCYLGDRLSCIVSFSSSFPLFHPNCSLTTPPPLETLIQTEALELTTCPRALIYERGEPKLSYQNRPVFHPFIWHLKSNYTNMLHCKTRAHCSKFRLLAVWEETEGKKQKSHPMISLCTDSTVLTKRTNIKCTCTPYTSLTMYVPLQNMNCVTRVFIQYCFFSGEDFSVTCLCVLNWLYWM